MYSSDKPEVLLSRRPRVITSGAKLASFILTTASFCAVVLTDGSSTVAIAIGVVSYLSFIGLSLFETLWELKKLRERPLT
jgi:hypothetical protein